MIQIMRFLSIGADEGARGLNRLMPNPFRESHVVDFNEIMEWDVQVKRPRVIQEILISISRHKAFRSQPKREQKDLLWPNARVEPACARLYLDILDEAGPWGSMQLSFKDFLAYGFSRNTGYKILATPPRWLKCEAIAGEGYRLSLCAEKALSDRAALVKDGLQTRAAEPEGQRINMSHAYLSAPERVLPGERNRWLVSLALSTKWKGIDLDAALKTLKSAAQRVPSYYSSLSLTREFGRIVGSIYRHSKESFGQDSLIELPRWFENEVGSFQKEKGLSQVFMKKGSVASRAEGLFSIQGGQRDEGAERRGRVSKSSKPRAGSQIKIWEESPSG